MVITAWFLLVQWCQALNWSCEATWSLCQTLIPGALLLQQCLWGLQRAGAAFRCLWKGRGSSWRAAEVSANGTGSGAAASLGQDPITAEPGRTALPGWSCRSAGAQCRPGRNQDTPRGVRMASLGIDKRDPAGARLRGLAAHTSCAAKGRKGRHTEPRAKQIRGPWWCLGENQKCSRLRAGATAVGPAG